MGAVIGTVATAVSKPAKKLYKKVGKEAERATDRKLVDTGKGLIKGYVAGAATGLGGNVATAAAANKAKQYVQGALTPPELPGLPGEAGGVPDVLPPTAENVGKAVATDVELQDNIRKKKRGRASNILTGSRGLAPISEGSLARKTLLGF